MALTEPNLRKEKCPIHGDYMAKVIDVPLGGQREIVSRCPECQKSSATENNANIKKNRKSEAIGSLDIPKRYKGKNFSNYIYDKNDTENNKAFHKCFDYAQNFHKYFEAGAGLLMCGLPGTGKTHLAYAIIKIVAGDHGKKTKYTTVYEMIKTIRDTWDRGSAQTEAQAIKLFTSPDLLVLDEFGVQSGTENEKTLMFQIIDQRYQDMNPTVLIGNLSIKELTEYIGERAIDRMREGGGKAAYFTWDSYRKKDQP